MKRLRKLPRFERTISAALIEAKEAVIAPMRPKLREFDISEPQWRVMRLLNDWGTSDASGLAQGGFLHAPSVARILKELEKRNFIRRGHDANDRRRTLATLTPEGHEIMRVISEDVLRVMEEYAGRFGNERLDWLQNELCDLSVAIKDVE